METAFRQGVWSSRRLIVTWSAPETAPNTAAPATVSWSIQCRSIAECILWIFDEAYRLGRIPSCWALMARGMVSGTGQKASWV